MLSRLKYFPYILLIMYIASLAIFMLQIGDLMNFSQDVLEKERDKVREVDARINEQQNILPSLFSTSGLNYSDTESEITRQERNRDALLNDLQKNYPGNAKDTAALQEAFRKYRVEVRKVATRLEHNSDFELAFLTFNRELFPYVRQILRDLNQIEQNLDREAAKVDRQIRFRMNLLTIFSLIFGAITFVVLILADKKEAARTTEIAYREKLFNQLSRNVDEIFIVAATPLDFTYVSPNSQELLGIDAESILADPGLLYACLQKNGLLQRLQEAFDSEGQINFPAEDIDIPVCKKSFRLRLFPMERISGRRERFIISIGDQTASIRNQEALALALENAHIASVAKSNFLSHMSHEIRTPMNVIIGMTTIALSKIPDMARVKDCLDKISSSSRHLLEIINNVLDMSKIESGKLSINNAPFHLGETLSHLRNLIQTQASAGNLQYDMDLENVDEDSLIGDSLRLNQILLNLLSNACKFTPAGGKISLRIQQIEKIGDTVDFLFIVSDNGVGMNEDTLSRLYSPFEQASAATAGKYGGTGLGMSITFNLVTLMGGSIQVESRENEGTKFTVQLPFEVGPAIESEKAPLTGLNILVVDDNPGACEHAALLLTKMGHNVRWVISGMEAVHLVTEAHKQGHDFDVCFMDWKIPEMDWLETARKIRQIAGPEFPIIIISSYDYESIRDDMEKLGIDQFIAKPFFSSTLHDALLAVTRKFALDSHEQPDAGKEKQYDFTGKRILLVEDNEFNREIGQEFLEMAHARVEHAANGKIAVDKVLSAPEGYYDLILMDVQMPVMNGYEATRIIRNSGHPGTASIAILAMTANAFSEDIANAAAAGLNGHIAKPIDIKELYEQLAVFLKDE